MRRPREVSPWLASPQALGLLIATGYESTAISLLADIRAEPKRSYRCGGSAGEVSVKFSLLLPV